MPTERVLGNEAEEGVEEETAPVVLSEAEERALRALVEKLEEAKARYYGEDMTARIDALHEELALDEGQIEQLRSVSQPVIRATMEGWREKAYDWLSPYVDKSNSALRDMARWPVDQMARSPGVKGVTPPDEQVLWMQELQRVLTEEQRQTWRRLREDEAREEQQNLRDFVEFAAQAMRPVMEEAMDYEINELRHLLELDEVRVEKLRTASLRAVVQAGEVWSQKALDTMQEMDRDRRLNLIARGNGLAVEETVRAQDQEAWKEAMAELLSKEEAAELKRAREGRRERRLQALTGALLLVLDKAMALTEDQRDALRPILRPASVQMQKAMDRYYNIDANFVAEALKEVDNAVFEPLLVPLQMASLARLKSPQDPYALPDDGEESAEEAPIETDEEMKLLLAEALYQRSDRQRARQMQQMATTIDDLRRTAQVPESRLSRLELAARGAVQDALAEWREQLDRWMRNSFNGVRPAQFRERLISLGEASFGDDPEPQETGLWKAVLKEELRPQEQARWQAEVERRQAHRRLVQRHLVITELEQSLALNESQLAKLEQPLDALLLEYAQDMDDFMSRPWFLQSYSLLMPVAGLDEKLIQSTFTPAQKERWLGEGLSQVQHYWDSVKRKHDSRIPGKEKGR